MNALVAETKLTPSSVTLDGCAFGGALVVYLMAAGGLFFHGAMWQLALACGAVAALFATRRDRAALAAGAAMVLGWAIGPPMEGVTQVARGDFGTLLAGALAAAAIAAAVHWAVSQPRRVSRRAVSALLVAFVVASFWATALSLDSEVFSVTEWLGQRPASAGPVSDAVFYAEIFNRVRGGQGYYEAVSAVWRQYVGSAPPALLDVRPPMQMWVLKLLAPRSPLVFYELLALASLAIAAGAVLAGTLVRRRLAVTAAIPVAMMFLVIAPGPYVMYAESWAVPLVLVSLAALVYAAAHERWKAAFVIGAGAALLAGAIREFCLILPVAGVAASLTAPPDRRRSQLTAWATVSVTLVLYYALHIAATSRILGPDAAGGAAWWFRPGLDNVVGAVRFFGNGFGAFPWVPYVLCLAGAVGVAAAPRGQVRALLAVVAGAFLLVLFLFGHEAIDAQTGQLLGENYWGIMLLPLLSATAPIAFALAPGLRRLDQRPSREPAASARRGTPARRKRRRS